MPGIVLDKWYQLIEEGMHELMTPIGKLCEFGYTNLLPGVEIIPWILYMTYIINSVLPLIKLLFFE